MKKRNILKRNSGFIAATIIAAGASFFVADTVLTELKPGRGAAESESEGALTQVPQSESSQQKTYETNPFTITASGAVINQVESEALGQQETRPEVSGEQNNIPETDAEGNMIEDNRENGTNGDGSSDDGSGSGGSSGGSGADNSGGSWDGSGSDNSGSSWDGSGSGSSGGSWDGSGSDNSGGSWDGSGSDNSGSSWDGSGSSSGSDISILDPGGGSWDGSGGSGSSGSGSSDGSYENGIFSPDDLILWHINSRYIGEEELYNYDAATIRLIRNEIFALHGRIFRSEDLQAYFSQKSWYVPMYDPDAFDENMESYLNDYELANLNVILAYEEALNG